MSAVLLLTICGLLIGAAAAPVAVRLGAARAPLLLAAIPAAAAVAFVVMGRTVADGEAVSLSGAWVPALDGSFAFRLDGLSLIFGVLITTIGALVVVYAGAYLGPAGRGRFYAFLLFFLAAMAGLVLADNVLALFLFWELTSVASFGLIGFQHDRPGARHAAQQALLVTGAGGLALLGGLVLLAEVGGSWRLSELAAPGAVDLDDGRTTAALVLIVLGAATKSAQVPFHFWLPAAMAAPTPVSAFLHSATMVKAGVYLLARLQPSLGAHELWTPILVPLGAATMVAGAWVALRETDLKRVLAYSTVSALGTLVMLIGIGDSAALKAALVFLVGHALYKAALFMVAGAIDHEAGTRDLRALGGLRRVMPLTAAAALVAGTAMAGVPPALAYLGKETTFAAALDAPAAVAVTGAALAAATLTVVAAARAGARPFWGKALPTPGRPGDGPWGLWLPPLLLAAAGLVAGVAAPAAGPHLLGPALDAIGGDSASLKLSLWPGFGAVLALSAAALGAGALLILVDRRTEGVFDRLPLPAAAVGYERAYAGLQVLATRHTRLIQGGLLRRHLLVVISVAVGLAGVALVAGSAFTAPGSWSDVRIQEGAAVALVVAAGVFAAATRSRLRAVIALGAAGYGIALVFALFGAPDLAMTQVLVETLTVILFVLVFRHLPAIGRASPWAARLRDAAVAGAFGAVMMAFTWSVTAQPSDRHVAEYFRASSRPLAEGRNVVNTILVDFRALDTLGEIAVLACAAIGVIAVLRLRAVRSGREP